VLTAGIDVGSAAVKVAVLRGTGVAALEMERYRRRSPQAVVAHALETALGRAGVAYDDLAYAATTGEGDMAPRRHGHFYGMTSHARGALHLDPRPAVEHAAGATAGRSTPGRSGSTRAAACSPTA